MENKYYTPSLEEFHVGFEFEHLNFEGKLVSFIEQKREWNKETCDWTWLDIICDDYEHDQEEVLKYRVKYLDKEDIESFNFFPMIPSNIEGKEREEYKVTYWVTDYYKDSYQILECYPYGKNEYHISFGNPERNTVLFKGIINNKSELRKILIQTGVCK